ncbi:MAG TPA: OadG family protein [Clostridiales bacterium]|nr:OadG family protein [Clostridiales bacterium]
MGLSVLSWKGGLRILTTMEALIVALFTITVVFVVLLLMWAAVRIFSLIIGLLERKKEKKTA